jgi:uncharacterized protein with WD repeat
MDTNKNELINMITYIKHKVGDLNVNERKDILQMLINAGIEDNKIQSKGRGTQIKFMDIPTDMIVSIYNFIQVKINEKIENLKNFTEENDEN